MPHIAVNGFEMYYETQGAGDPLLLLHGGMGIGADWRLVFAEPPPPYRLIMPDLRGHGRSTAPPDGFTFRDCARDVLALLDHLDIRRARAIGLSLGAKTLLHVATMAPERIDAMVLVSAVPRFPDTLRAAAGQFTREALAGLSADDRSALRQRHVHGDAQLEWLYAMMRSFAAGDGGMAFTTADLATIDARTLIVHGDHDPLYGVELAVELFRAIHKSALWVVPYGGHGPIFGPTSTLFAATALAHLSDSQ